MPTRPSRLTSLDHKDAVNIINKGFSDISNAVNQLEQASDAKRISSLSTLVFGNGTIPANSSVNSTVNILGASTTLVATANPTLPLDTGHSLTWQAYVSKNGQVTVKVTNPTTAPIVMNTTNLKWNILVH
jgi:hypothetical protein